ncbi:FUSC family protein [Kaistia dalseonensis]|uniref:Membrane protein YccC n=1 Tax=Kaistia dalseonensis TaxID=410840 RepID=A0ABU0H9Q3_9HYPH|nr:FUSC family protein [Kaistia dalseonensis]MCX5495598.1 FUSC family protein [Kaistia dalseonensis]MDQ0438191.1 putative membrane protein YccC [Kaistia dalseonensis]
MSVTSRLGLPMGSQAHRPLKVILYLRGSLGQRLFFAFRLAISVCLALAITYYLELQNSFWAATTAAIVCQANFGASLQKGRYRILGTLTGALVMVALLGLFAQERDMLILSMALFCGLCGFAAVALQGFAAYAAALAGITATIIFADTLTDPTNAFFLSLIRVSEIGIGIGAATLVMLVTDLDQAGRQLAGLLERSAGEVASGFVASMASATETDDMRAARREATHALAPLNAAIEATIAGSPHRHARRGNLNAVRDALLAALVGWRNVGHHPGRPGADGAATRAHLAELVRSLAAATIGRDPATLKAASVRTLRDLDAMPGAGSLDGLLKSATRDVVCYLATTADALLVLRGCAAEVRPIRRRRLVIDDPLLTFLAGFRAFAAVLAISIFAIVTGWSSGSFAIVFTAVVTLVFVARDDAAPAFARDNAIGTTLMAVAGGLIYFGLLPAFTTFPALLCLLFLLFAMLGFLQAGTWHPIVFLAMTISALPMLGLGNPTTYDAAAYFNLCLAIIVGNLAGVLFFVVLPVPSPQLRMRRLITHSLHELRACMRRETPDRIEIWTQRLERRLETAPAGATLADVSALLSLLAVGQAVISLKSAQLDAVERHFLRQGLDALADARLDAARTHLGAMAGAAAASAMGDRIGAAIAVIIDAIDGHPHLLTSGGAATA